MYTDDEIAFAAEVRAFVRGALDPQTRDKVMANQSVDGAARRVWHQALFHKGWAAPQWPQEWGGTDWSAVQNYLFAEVMAEEGAPELSAFGLRMLAPTLMSFGTQEQKDYYLPRILSGEHQWCQGFSEPGAGSDLASLSTRAQLVGDHWVVNGQKMWTTGAHEADMMFALVRTDPDAPKRQMGISMLLIDMKTPGIDVRPIMLLNGQRTTNEVFFDDVKTPAANLVGEPNKGWNYTRVVLGNERLSIARVGQSKRQLQRLKRLASAEQDGGGRLIDQPLFRAKVAAAEIELMAVEAMSLRLLAAAKVGATPGFEANMLKIKGSELQQRLSELIADAVGPYGMPFGDGGNAEDPGAGTFKSYFDTRVVSIYGGSNEIQRNIIAKGMLGLESRK